jgi:uncharacterized Zn ribbon protein
MKKINKKRISKLMILTILANLMFTNITQTTASASSGTIDFVDTTGNNGVNGANIGSVVNDGTTVNDITVSDINDIKLNIFNTNDPINLTPTGSFVYFKDEFSNNNPVIVPISEKYGNAQPGDKDTPKIFVIKSSDSILFDFKSIYMRDYLASEQQVKFEGFKNGSSTGSVILDINQTTYEETFDSSDLPPSIFQNVDEVRITNQYGGDMAYGNWAAIGSIKIDTIATPPQLCNGLSFSDPIGGLNNGKTQINLGAPSVSSNTFKYIISSDGNSIQSLPIGADASNLPSIKNGDMIIANSGAHIGVYEVDSNGRVVQFSDAKAVVTNEDLAPVTNITLTDNDTNAGIDGRDFSIGFTDSTDDEIVDHYYVYLYKASDAPLDSEEFNRLAKEDNIPVKVIQRTTELDGTTQDLGFNTYKDSKGQPLVEGDYVVVVTAKDIYGGSSFAKITSKINKADTEIKLVATDTKGIIVNSNLTSKTELSDNGVKVTLTAPAKEGYNFLGWIKEGSESIESTNLIYSFALEGQTSLSYKAVYQPLEYIKLTVNTDNFSISANNITTNISTGLNSNTFDYTLGTEITLVANNTKGDFAYWKNEYGMILSSSQTIKFILTKETAITAVYNTINESKTLVNFESDYKQVITSAEVMADGSDVENCISSFPSGPSKAGYNFIGWKLDNITYSNTEFANFITALKSKLTAGSLITITPVYQKKTEICTLTLTNGTVAFESTIIPETPLEKGTYPYYVGTNVTAIANPAEEGKKFSHWILKDTNTVLSYSETYSFKLSESMTIEAVYVNIENKVEKVPTIEITGKSAYNESGVSKVSFTATRDIPEGYTLLSYGMLITNNIATGEDDTAFKIGGIDVISTTRTSGGNNYTLAKKNAGTGVTWYGRGYVTYRDNNGNTITKYSNIASVTSLK